MKLIMENWRKYLLEREIDYSPEKQLGLTEEMKHMFIAHWHDNYVKGKKWNPAIVKHFSSEEKTETGQIISKDERDLSGLYKGDNAYYSVLLRLISLKKNPNRASSEMYREFIADEVKTLEKYNPTVKKHFDSAWIAVYRYGQLTPDREKANPLAFERLKRMAAKGKKIELQFTHKINSEIEIQNKAKDGVSTHKYIEKSKQTHLDPKITGA